MGLRRAAAVVVGIALALVLAGLPTAVPAAAATTFTDVPANAPYAADARWMVDRGITTAAGGRFRPTATVTRQEAAVFLYRTSHAGRSAPACTVKPYSDVPASSPYCGAIAWLKAARVVAAGPAFGPSTPTTRQYLAVAVSRLAGGTPPRACTSAPFRDVPVSSSACAAVAWLKSQGIAVGLSDGTFRPTSAATRAATATFLHGWSDVRSPVLGADVSHPQCGRPLPTGQAFGIVGVNAGTATTTNPCLATQLAWARGSVGGTGQPRVQLYVNTANPGGLDTPTWPRSGTNRYGTCTGANSTACAYQYGRDRAREDVTVRGVSRPQDFVWWLDVELENTWDLTAAGAARNVAVLEGMVEQLRSVGVAGVGLYSTAYQWTTIVRSSVPANSPLNGLPSWLAGARTVAGARAACQLPPLTRGGRVAMAQYIDGFDRNHSCT
ncbi:S-layer homology domain-containing protein [Geodermatophilus sp. SYSU D00697]